MRTSSCTSSYLDPHGAPGSRGAVQEDPKVPSENRGGDHTGAVRTGKGASVVWERTGKTRQKDRSAGRHFPKQERLLKSPGSPGSACSEYTPASAAPAMAWWAWRRGRRTRGEASFPLGTEDGSKRPAKQKEGPAPGTGSQGFRSA